MDLKVVGAGLGRTGTFSLKLALEQLGFGPCHHMDEVLKGLTRQIPLWSAAIDGRPDWEAIFQDYNSAVDWPAAAFWRELAAAYPGAKFILTTRSAEDWYQSYSETIFKVLSTAHEAPPHLKAWLEMATAVTGKTGLGGGKASQAEIIRAFMDHDETVRKSIPADRLLVFEVRDGWAPLCTFLGRPIPSVPFPVTNRREEFWELIGR